MTKKWRGISEVHIFLICNLGVMNPNFNGQAKSNCGILFFRSTKMKTLILSMSRPTKTVINNLPIHYN